VLKFSGNNGIEAIFYEKLEGNMVQCHLCSHHCRIVESRREICGVRENRGGTLYSLVYGNLFQTMETLSKRSPYSTSSQDPQSTP
jgi:pyruvate formate lyase activating enzyme